MSSYFLSSTRVHVVVDHEPRMKEPVKLRHGIIDIVPLFANYLEAMPVWLMRSHSKMTLNTSVLTHELQRHLPIRLWIRV
jgi:hypothetical protein